MPDNALKALIRATETGKTDPAIQYETIIGHNQKHLARPITSMSVGEIIAASDGWRKRFGTTSGAAGAYQIIKPTLVGLRKEMMLSGQEKFTPTLQDRMADRLLETRGLSKFLRFELSVEQFGNNLAREWASFPVLSTQQRNDNKLTRGQSYYDKFAGNSALIKPDKVEAVLRQLRSDASFKPAPDAAPTPTPSIPTYVPGDTDEPTGVSGGVGLVDVILIAVAVLLVLTAAFMFWPR